MTRLSTPDATLSSDKISGTVPVRPGQREWHALPVAAVASYLDTDLHNGLSSDAASARQAALGFNELQETPPPTLWARFLEQLQNFVVLILIAASLLSLVLGDYVEGVGDTV